MIRLITKLTILLLIALILQALLVISLSKPGADPAPAMVQYWKHAPATTQYGESEAR